MLRPGLRDPRQGPRMTALNKRRITPAMKQRSPLLGGGMRKPVAGPGARWMNARQGAPMNFLQERLQSILAGHRPALTPMMAPPTPEQVGEPFEQPSPPPFDRFHPVGGGLAGRGPGPTSPIGLPPGLLPGGSQDSWQPAFPGSDIMQPSGPSSPVGLPGINLIPLGGGQYIDPNTGQVHGLGGGHFAY